jgi:hypothetical protein
VLTDEPYGSTSTISTGFDALLSRCSTLNNIANILENNSSSTRTTETVIERKLINNNTTKTNRPSVTSSSAKTNSKKSSTSKLVNVADLEKVINNLIEMKLQEKNLVISSPTTSTLKTPTPSPLLQIDTSVIKKSIPTPPPSNTPTNSSTSNNSRPSRFHSPEASKRIPVTMRNKDDEKVIAETQRIINIQQQQQNTIPSVLSLKNNEKYPDNKSPSIGTQNSTKVYSKLKNWLNKVGKSDESPINQTDLLCGKNKTLASLCLGSSIQHVNSDFNFASQQQQPQKENEDCEIVPVKSQKLNASPPKKHVSLFSEIGKDLANIERNSNLMSNTNSKLYNNNQQKSEVIYQMDDDDNDDDESIFFKETTLMTSDNSTIVTNNYDDENYYTANSSSIIYGWDAFDEDKIEKLKDEVFNKTVVSKMDDVLVLKDVKR